MSCIGKDNVLTQKLVSQTLYSMWDLVNNLLWV